ncbi:MAG: cysteine hydrolase, partial [Pseudomonadota bacterium]
MATLSRKARTLIQGRPALIVIDIHASTVLSDIGHRSIDNVLGYREHVERTRGAIDRARASALPVIFIQ